MIFGRVIGKADTPTAVYAAIGQCQFERSKLNIGSLPDKFAVQRSQFNVVDGQLIYGKFAFKIPLRNPGGQRPPAESETRQKTLRRQRGLEFFFYFKKVSRGNLKMNAFCSLSQAVVMIVARDQRATDMRGQACHVRLLVSESDVRTELCQRQRKSRRL